MTSTRAPWWLTALGALFVVFSVALVASSLRRPSLPTYAPTPVPTAAATDGDSLVSSRVITLDARDPDEWVRFSFSRSGVVSAGDDRNWDLAARRFHLIVNGGEGFAGEAGALDLGEVPFAEVKRVPRDGYLSTERGGGEPRHPALEDWYRYSFLSHLLRPEPRTYAIRTAGGRYAKLRLLSYYCPGAEPGCVTFRYSFQGNGGTSFVPASSSRGPLRPG